MWKWKNIAKLNKKCHFYKLKLWETKCLPSLYFSKNLGNIYTGALIGCLVSLLTDDKLDTDNKKIMMFSYGYILKWK